MPMPRRPTTTNNINNNNNTTTEDDADSTSFLVKDILNDLVVVSGFWKVDKNVKHNLTYYEKGVKETLEFFRQFPSVHFFHNIHLTNSSSSSEQERIIASILRDHAAAHQGANSHTELIYRPTEDLQLYPEALQFAKKCQEQDNTHIPCGKGEKSKKHHQRLTESSVEDWAHIVAVWISKLWGMQHAMKHNPQAKYFVWIDGGIFSRTELQVPLHQRFLSTVGLDPHHVWMRPSGMNFNCTPIQFNAAIIMGAREPLEQLIVRFYEEVQTILGSDDEPLCYDEEAIITRVYNRYDDVKTLIKPIRGLP
jgi:hypothetical protein